MTRDVTEILDTLDLKVTNDKFYRVAYHDACSLQHGQRVMEPPRDLLAKAGFEVVDLPEKHFCCGSAGTYNLLQPEIAETLGQRKASHAESLDPDFIAAGNLGCMVQIGRYTRIAGAAHGVADRLGDRRADAGRLARRERCASRSPNRRRSKSTAGAAAPSGDSGFW